MNIGANHRHHKPERSGMIETTCGCTGITQEAERALRTEELKAQLRQLQDQYNKSRKPFKNAQQRTIELLSMHGAAQRYVDRLTLLKVSPEYDITSVSDSPILKEKIKEVDEEEVNNTLKSLAEHRKTTLDLMNQMDEIRKEIGQIKLQQVF